MSIILGGRSRWYWVPGDGIEQINSFERQVKLVVADTLCFGFDPKAKVGCVWQIENHRAFNNWYRNSFCWSAEIRGDNL